MEGTGVPLRVECLLERTSMDVHRTSFLPIKGMLLIASERVSDWKLSIPRFEVGVKVVGHSQICGSPPPLYCR